MIFFIIVLFIFIGVLRRNLGFVNCQPSKCQGTPNASDKHNGFCRTAFHRASGGPSIRKLATVKNEVFGLIRYLGKRFFCRTTKSVVPVTSAIHGL